MDPRSGQIFRLTNRTWARQQYNEVMFTVAKNMSNNFQAMASIQHQWQKEDGTWNPTDPAGFIQPDAFANDKTIWRNQDPVDNNSLATGNTLRNTPDLDAGVIPRGGHLECAEGHRRVHELYDGRRPVDGSDPRSSSPPTIRTS